MVEEGVAPANEANDFAANILSQPTEGEVDNSRDGMPIEATARSEPQVLLADMRHSSDRDHRDDGTKPSEGQVAHSRSDHREQKDSAAQEAERAEDLSIREARDAFPDDGYGL